MKHFMFNWINGGFNDVKAENLEDAIVKATEFGSINPGTRRSVVLVPDPKSFRIWTDADCTAMCRAYPID